MSDSKYNGTVRHAIEFYGLKCAIPAALQKYPGFFYSEPKGRITFVVGNGTSFQKLTGEIYSTDQSIQTFNKIFGDANKNVDWTKIKSYDFKSTENTDVKNTAPIKPNIPTPTPTPTPVNPIPAPVNPNPYIPVNKDTSKETNTKHDENTYMKFAFVAAGVFVAYQVFGKKGKKRR